MTSPTTDAVRSPTAGSGRESAAGRRRGRTETGEGTWSIAQIADEFGVTHRTVRHYEDLGLISPERRGTTRVYHRRDRTRLGLILRGRRLGFPLDEIRTIIDLYDVPRGRRSQLEYVLAQIGERRSDLEQRRRDLESALAELVDFERRCREDLEGLDEPGTLR
ncbi:MAG TPA: MerR family DNA-binding transcriptional regulator [Ornithinibacter sp.]|mgnify:FL=1|jgi:DNA-binding transcriptional MerR regulator|nr:MerR family DNA-binding transcriptional regulator [Dermatophilaceae bacterium]HNV42615.1 MerR family DNA-binding transcriptional regulator [Ornithinibacter sp.]HOB78937.1 MerR family DNA-binding transcriptional regulator [Ornithinibacter sp.]HOT55890.1 MerR family DNA-binding transcriptional regulator [Ornithinibacter sp.]HPV89744.1 MerR family DNA-binding transcriptional regulator [Ornithinibacter sp.]